MSFRDFMAARAGAKAFSRAAAAGESLVFYAEDSASYVHFSGMIAELRARDVPMLYLTSASDDPLLSQSAPGFEVFYIGSGVVRTALFVNLKARVVVMTMPDLHSVHIKRSRAAQINYVYVFHSIVSTHLIYKSDAFDHYDTILTVGPHQDTEIRLWEAAKNLKEKALVPIGYGRLDAMRNEVQSSPDRTELRDGPVLVAPSWGDTCILETIGVALCQTLLEAGHSVVVRPHPMSVKRNPGILTDLEKRCGGDNFSIETDIRGFDSMARCSAMISDWSGVAFEYAFTFERPVLFIDTAMKTRNPEWGQIDAQPVEVSYRDRLGALVSPNALHEIPAKLELLRTQSRPAVEKIRLAREELVHNLDHSATAAADFLQGAMELTQRS